jgi:hypothetical protein
MSFEGTFTDNQLSHWRQLKAQFESDPEWKSHYAEVRAKRQVVRPQIGELLTTFLSGAITLETFRATWDSKTRGVWKSFGLAGLSSAMFLNQLVKHLPDPGQTTEELKRVIQIPEDEQTGRSRLQVFEAFLERKIMDRTVTRRMIQTARTPFFISAFWHMQNPEPWPMFYISARNVFEKHGLYVPKYSVVEDYFAFRDVYLSLMSALKANSWDVEQVCLFEDAKDKPVEKVVEPDTSDDEEVKEDEQETKGDGTVEPSAHAHAQWLLASLGKTFGLKVWIAPNDRQKEWNSQRLGDMSIPILPPLGVGFEDAEKIVRRIDVLWLRGSNQIVAAFEIEHSTSIYSGLLRMADLTAMCANILFPIYIVAPESRIHEVEKQLSRPSLQRLGLHEVCGVFSIEALIEKADDIKMWAKDPDAMKKLATKVKPLEAK